MKKFIIFSACFFAGFSFSQTNLLGNGGFESGTTNDEYWMNTGVSGALLSYGTEAVDNSVIEPHEGNYCGQKKNWAEGSNLIQVVDVTPGETYEFTFYSRVEEGKGDIETVARIREYVNAANSGQWISMTPETDNAYTEDKNDVTNSILKYTVSDSEWTKTTLSFTVPDGVNKVRTNFWSNDNPHRYYDTMSITVKETASNNDFTKFNFNYAPNPANNVINLSAAKTISKVDFYNTLGQNVLTNPINTLNSSVNISAFKKGIYIMNVTINGQTQGFKILKQ